MTISPFNWHIVNVDSSQFPPARNLIFANRSAIPSFWKIGTWIWTRSHGFIKKLGRGKYLYRCYVKGSVLASVPIGNCRIWAPSKLPEIEENLRTFQFPFNRLLIWLSRQFFRENPSKKPFESSLRQGKNHNPKPPASAYNLIGF